MQVEFNTRKKGKKMQAVRVKLLGVRECRKSVEEVKEGRMEGVVTYWVPEQLAGSIATVLGEVRMGGVSGVISAVQVFVCRANFRPGGFVPQIVGRYHPHPVACVLLTLQVCHLCPGQRDDGGQGGGGRAGGRGGG